MGAAPPHALDGGRITVVSPHLDDAVMSLGATIAAAVRRGASVDVLTVFGYGPASEAPAGPWDTKSGYRTEAEACRARRNEDQRACRMLGATPRWLDFGAEPYERRGTPAEILAAMIAATANAQCVLIPGFPLNHPDHAELSRLLLDSELRAKMALYAEQPYLFWERDKIPPDMRAPALDDLLNGSPHWLRQPATREDRRLKFKAVRCYRSQLRQLGMRPLKHLRMHWHEASQGGEPVAWLS